MGDIIRINPNPNLTDLFDTARPVLDAIRSMAPEDAVDICTAINKLWSNMMFSKGEWNILTSSDKIANYIFTIYAGDVKGWKAETADAEPAPRRKQN